MIIGDVSKSVQFVVDDEGKRTAVLLDIQTWGILVDWIETVTDTKFAVEAITELQRVGGRPEQAGWLAWDGEDETAADTNVL